MTRLQRLRLKHQQDLILYRGAHKEWRNRRLHHFLIPLEVLSFQLALKLIVRSAAINTLVACSLAVLSLTVASRLIPGIAAFLFHVFSAWLTNQAVLLIGVTKCWLMALTTWVVSWGIQVGIGHYLLEKNSPSVAKMSDVSSLAICLSVLIAWSS